MDTLEVTLAVAWIVHIINNSNSTVEEGDILFKRMKDGSFCKGIILPAKPLVLVYSKSQEKNQGEHALWILEYIWDSSAYFVANYFLAKSTLIVDTV